MIRKAKSSDYVRLRKLMIAHAKFEGITLSKDIDALPLIHLLSSPADIYVVTLGNDKNLQGYMSLLKQYSTWSADWYLYLDCLYLNEEMRSKGIGNILMKMSKEIARDKRISELQWQTPSENKRAISFYHGIGAKSLNKKRFFYSADA